MNYPPPNLWMIIQMDPKPEPEPRLVELTPKLRVPADWPKDRINKFLAGWNARLFGV